MDVTVIGCGYVGLVTAACLAKLGHKVTCIDKNSERIELLKQGKCPIYEPGLEKLLPLVNFSSELTIGDIVFIAVGTPANPDGSCNINYVLAVAKEVAELNKSCVLVTKSTVPIGTGKMIAEIAPLCEIVSNPEFLREGEAIKDFMYPDRIVIGAETAFSRLMMDKLYSPIKAPILHTSIKSAELIKYASNGFLAMKLAYVNELSWLAKESGADIEQVTLGMGMDKRIGPDYLKVGPGFGGSCFPKDVASLMAQSKSPLIKEILISNDRHQSKILAMIEDISKGSIGVLGTAFKANTDDIRDSPALVVVSALGDVKTYDPQAPCNSTFEEVMTCDTIIIATEWDEFKDLKTDKIVIDLRSLGEPGPGYHCLGRVYK